MGYKVGRLRVHLGIQCLGLSLIGKFGLESRGKSLVLEMGKFC